MDIKEIEKITIAPDEYLVVKVDNYDSLDYDELARVFKNCAGRVIITLDDTTFKKIKISEIPNTI